MNETKFNFGNNWMKFSKTKVDEQKLKEAEKSLSRLIGENYIKGKSFLDIVCGSGIFSIAAKRLGAEKVVGFDLSEESIISADHNATRFNMEKEILFFKGSILDDKLIDSLGKFDIVYSWGVLHHTGKMWLSINTASRLVNVRGMVVIAIYNSHWSSPIWRGIKLMYNKSPNFFKEVMIWTFYIVILITKGLVTNRNPFKMKRGMDFYYNVVDWIGGYPYEHATTDEVNRYLHKRGFKAMKIINTHVPTGCNEFVFKRSY